LYAANLYGADLTWAYLTGANLSGVYLNGANLSQATLDGANLTSAKLYYANLYAANLYGADLTWAYLTGANLSGANLTSAKLYYANLYAANLSRANLSRAGVSAMMINCRFSDTIVDVDTNFSYALIDNPDLLKYLRERNSQNISDVIKNKLELREKLKKKGLSEDTIVHYLSLSQLPEK
jgi:uncharacterized protein YjbI with pentapeptide repeats